MTDNPAILCVGRLYCDVIFTDLPRMPTMGTEIFAGGVGLHAGGGASITAAHLASLGHRAILCARLPAAPLGQLVTAELQNCGVDTRFCTPANDDEEPQLTVALVYQGERSFITRRSGPAHPDICADAIRAAGIKHVHIGELTTLIEQPGLVAAARLAGATVSLDCSWDDDHEIENFAALLPQIDVFLPNESEFHVLKNLGLREPFARLTVLKQGAHGATALTANDRVHAPANKTPVVDTTGAGDAFNAGFLGAWLNHAPLSACLSAGNSQGAKAVSVRGGFPHPARVSACGQDL